MGSDFDVFVIGGGPAGLATAIAAAQRGLRVAVADAWGPGIDKACGEGLMPDSVEALGALGVTVPREAGHPFPGLRFLGSGISVDARFPSGTGLGVTVPREAGHPVPGLRFLGSGISADARLPSGTGLGVTVPREAGHPFPGLRFLGSGISVDARFPS